MQITENKYNKLIDRLVGEVRISYINRNFENLNADNPKFRIKMFEEWKYDIKKLITTINYYVIANQEQNYSIEFWKNYMRKNGYIYN